MQPGHMGLQPGPHRVAGWSRRVHRVHKPAELTEPVVLAPPGVATAMELLKQRDNVRQLNAYLRSEVSYHVPLSLVRH